MSNCFIIFFRVYHICRLHSAGHLMDACMQNVRLGALVPTKGYHFADGYEAMNYDLSLSLYIYMILFFH